MCQLFSHRCCRSFLQKDFQRCATFFHFFEKLKQEIAMNDNVLTPVRVLRHVQVLELSVGWFCRNCSHSKPMIFIIAGVVASYEQRSLTTRCKLVNHADLRGPVVYAVLRCLTSSRRLEARPMKSDQSGRTQG